jgi:hypothetical protein
VVFGCARDIVERCGVPRFVWSDFPLGSPCGRPHDPAMQAVIVGMGLDVLASATGPAPTAVTPYQWSADEGWKERVFTPAQPFLDEDATAKWLARKEAYRHLRASGEV